MKKFWTILRIAGTCIGVISILILMSLGESEPVTPIQILKVGFALLFIGSAGVLSAVVANKKLQKYKIDNYSRIFPENSRLSSRLFIR